MNMPPPFLPNAKPRNLKFLIANTLTVRLLSRFTVSFSFPSRNLTAPSSRRSDALLLFAKSTISSAYLMQGTPRFTYSQSNTFKYIFASRGDRFPPYAEKSLMWS